MRPPARNSAGFLRAKRKRLRPYAHIVTRLELGYDQHGMRPWQYAQRRIANHRRPANAWSLWGKAWQIKQRLVHLDKLPNRHARTPIVMSTRRGIGDRHAGARLMKYVHDKAARMARCSAILTRLADARFIDRS